MSGLEDGTCCVLMRHDESHLLLAGNDGETLGTRCDTESDAHSSAHLTQRNSRLINDDRKSRLMHGLGRVSRLLQLQGQDAAVRSSTEEARLLGGDTPHRGHCR